jgi:protoporphyrinogen oxidase
MTAEWCGMFVPQPKLEDVVAGSKRRPKKAFGYNTTFLYPKRGGIQVLPEALAEGLKVHTETPFEEVDWKRKRVRLSTGEWKDYDFLVNSAPLAELLKRMTDLPEDIAKTLPKLKWTSVLCINLGVRRPKISDKSWIYFPEKKYRFYRVGFPMNFTPHVAPKGCSSMYVEVGYPPEKKLHLKKEEILKRVRKDLIAGGILKKSDKIATTCVIPIPYAYVVYTPERKALTEKIFKFLQDHRIYSIGRYGAWKYSFMEEAILDGKKTAETIRGLAS